jgi:hypothetical protein
MPHDRNPGRLQLRRGACLAGLTLLLLLAMTAVAGAQGNDTTTDEVTTDETTTDETVPSEEPAIPEGFTEDECDFTTREDGTQVVTCRHEEQSRFEETATAGTVVTERVQPVGATATGAGGTAGDGDASLPIIIGLGGLALALSAAALERRRRFD